MYLSSCQEVRLYSARGHVSTMASVPAYPLLLEGCRWFEMGEPPGQYALVTVGDLSLTARAHFTVHEEIREI